MRMGGYVVAAALAIGGAGMSTAEAAEAGLEGAWLQEGTECADVFARTGKATSFKKPVNIFAPAFIISGNQVRTPQASCRIRSVKPAGERRILVLSCATPVSVDQTRAILAPAENGSLRRYLNDQDTTGSSYRRCT
jgi:hypothetical protein